MIGQINLMNMYVQASLIDVFYFTFLFQVFWSHPDDRTSDKTDTWKYTALAIIIFVLAVLLMKIIR